MKRFRLPFLLAITLALCTCLPALGGAPAPSATAPKDLASVAAEVAKEVETLRGWTFKKPVESRSCTPQQALAYVKKMVDEQAPPEKVRKLQAFLGTVGLLPQGCDLKKTLLGLLEEQVGGYYDTDAEALYLVEHGEKQPELVLRILLAHELTHALDDQHLGLEAFLESLIG